MIIFPCTGDVASSNVMDSSLYTLVMQIIDGYNSP